MALQYVEPKQITDQISDRFEQIVPYLDDFNLSTDDLQYFSELSPYLILDGHRTGLQNNDNPAKGYIEGAIFSLRFARVLQQLGCDKSTFLIHTLRNYQTMDRMKAIFSAIKNIAKKFITTAYESNIRLRYFGNDVHDGYAISGIINRAEEITKNCNGFDLNFVTNYSEEWGMNNSDMIEAIPEISVIGRFTKGHYSGAGIPGHSNKANFIYIQQASISENWTDRELILLALSLLKSHLSLRGFVGGKTYKNGEKERIREAREELMWEEVLTSFDENQQIHKRLVSFSPKGPINIKF